MRRKLYLETFGCQMNLLDSELVLGQLHARGYESVDDRDDADVILYNTCSVREHAEQKVWSRLGELRPRKEADPGLIIGVIGCLAERDGANLFKRHPYVDILCGPGELDKLTGMVQNAGINNGPSQRQAALMGKAGSRRTATLAAAEDHLEMLDLSRSVSPADDVAQAYVRITRGCNKFCTYCVVPYTRGPEVHRPRQNIIDEVRKLADAGVKEVTLLGQTINHYAYQHADGRLTSFADLLYEIHEAVPHLPRLRFVTSFPRDFTDQALDAMRDCPRICRYLHVPAQHGSDRILKLMNRGYTAGAYRDFVARAREKMPDICLASDFIVGFPTESDDEFSQTMDLLRACRFKNSFIFKYSPRPGTTAIDRFADDIPDDVKRRRNNELLDAQQQVSAEENKKMVGKTVEVMVEGESKLVSRRSKGASAGGAGSIGDKRGVVNNGADKGIGIGENSVEGSGGGRSGGGERSGSRGQSGVVQLGWKKQMGAPAVLNNAEAAQVVGEPQPDGRSLQLVGRTRGDQVVVFDGEASLKGSLLQVQIVDAQSLTLFARRL